jgi:hypothetical protein
VKSVYQLATGQSVKFEQPGEDVLIIDLPPQNKADNVVIAVEVDGEPIVDQMTKKLVRQDQNGKIECLPHLATIHIDGEDVSEARIYSKGYIGYWTQAKCYISWTFLVRSAGVFNVELAYACPRANKNNCEVEIAGRKLAAPTPSTNSGTEYKTIDIGQIEIEEAGEHVLTIRYGNKKIVPVNIKSIKLVPAVKSGGC